MRYSLLSRKVLVTGGGNGVGRLLALGAAQRGARVVIWDLDAESTRRVCQEICSAGAQAESFTVDVSDRQAVLAAAEQTGEVDVLINNAGVVSGKTLLDAENHEIERTFAVNVHSLYWVTRAFLGGMIRRNHGAVVTMASAAGLVGVPRQTDYSASKFAAFGFAESLRAELARDNSAVNSLVVCPAYISTGMFDGVRTRFPLLLPILRPEAVAERTLRGIERGSSQLVMPRLARAIPVARVMPLNYFDTMMRFFGVSTSMDGFRGRQVDALVLDRHRLDVQAVDAKEICGVKGEGEGLRHRR